MVGVNRRRLRCWSGVGVSYMIWTAVKETMLRLIVGIVLVNEAAGIAGNQVAGQSARKPQDSAECENAVASATESASSVVSDFVRWLSW